MEKDKKLRVKGMQIYIFQKNKNDYISLTDIARYQDSDRVNYIVQNWMRKRSTIEFLGLWEKLNNPNFKGIEFDAFKIKAGLNSFSLTPKHWIETTAAIGLISRSGRYGGGTFAHKDIAFEFASWISPEFKLYLIKEFQRLKEAENQKLSLGWNVKRELAKINYKIHTDAIKQNLIPFKINQIPGKFVYASEGDLLNKALFSMTAKEWHEQNPGKEGNIRDYSTIEQLVVLSNLESLNAELIKQGIEPEKRLLKLNQIAIDQMKSILGHPALKKLE
ncbi:MAG: KilA-N domain-containing protein [Patescibacteria group bacterium]|mgnify:CR=1 FL=1